MDHRFGELQKFKEQMGWGGGQQNRLAGGKRWIEVAWDGGPQENKQLRGTSKTITSGEPARTSRSQGSWDKQQREEASSRDVHVTSGSDNVLEPETGPGLEEKATPELQLGLSTRNETVVEEGFRNTFFHLQNYSLCGTKQGCGEQAEPRRDPLLIFRNEMRCKLYIVILITSGSHY